MPSGHVDGTKPLRPLSDHAWAVLAWCARAPRRPGWEANPGVWDRLLREKLVEQIPGASRFYRVTPAGLDKLQERR